VTLQLNPAQITNRIHHARPDWRPAGVHSAVTKALHDHAPELVLRAGLAAAADPSARTPAVIPIRCEHERELIAAGRRPPLSEDAREPDSPLPAEHCQRAGCPCSHRGDCDGGWIATGAGGREEDTLRPCPTCRPSLAERFAQPAGWRVARDRKLAELAASRSDDRRREILDGLRAQLAARRASLCTTTTDPSTQEGMTA
jgi:hypothetical protein